MGMIYAGRNAEKKYIKPGGENVYIAEVEKVILEYPSVKKVVFGVPYPKWKEGIKEVWRLKKGVSIDPKELMDFVREWIAGFKRPEHAEFALELPDFQDSAVYRAGEVFLLLLIIELLNFYSSAYSYTSLLFHEVDFVVNRLPCKA